jgi:YegS/Rv2252/BmrU family lipid kinase
MRRHFLVIHNPRAGLKQGPLLMQTLDELQARGCELEFAVAASAEEDARLAREAVADGRVDAVVAAGGDSTVRGVATGLLGTAMPLGLLPVGTGNVLAHEIGLARRPGAIAATLMQGPLRTIRFGQANDQLFLLMAGVGFDAEVVRHLDHRLKQRVLKAAYVWPTLRALAAPLPRLRVTLDGRVRNATFVVASRTRNYGGTMLLAPAASIERDDFQVVLFDAASRARLVAQLLALARGRIDRARGVDVVTARELGIDAAEPVAFQLDGELAGTTPLKLTLASGGFDLIVPPAA